MRGAEKVIFKQTMIKGSRTRAENVKAVAIFYNGSGKVVAESHGYIDLEVARVCFLSFRVRQWILTLEYGCMKKVRCLCGFILVIFLYFFRVCSKIALKTVG